MKAISIFSVWMTVSSVFAIPVTDPMKVDKDNIKIYFYDQDNILDDTQIDITDKEAVLQTTFSNAKPTFFIVHGWNNDVSSEMCTTVRNALLSIHDVNVFVVDWSSIAEGTYVDAFAAVEQIGKVLATLIQNLISNNDLDLGNTAIIGHSLGAHVAGVAGTALESECSYVVGLDPAGPLFQYNVTSNRITSTSGQFVQIIHTCGSSLGMYEALGTADYYPNGGLVQNGCSTDDYGACSHGRSYMYYAESIVSGQFIAQKCDSYEAYEDGTCAGTTSWLGGYSIDTGASGSYYLDTNSESPFAI